MQETSEDYSQHVIQLAFGSSTDLFYQDAFHIWYDVLWQQQQVFADWNH